MSLSPEDLHRHLKEVATPEMLAQISPQAMQQGLQDMSEALSRPAPQTERENGRSR